MEIHRLIFSCSSKSYKNYFLLPLCLYISKIKKTCIFNWRTESYWHFRHPNKSLHYIYLFILTNAILLWDAICAIYYLCYRVPHYNVYFLFFPEAGQGPSWHEGLNSQERHECNGTRNTSPLTGITIKNRASKIISSPQERSPGSSYLFWNPQSEKDFEKMFCLTWTFIKSP